MEQKKEGPPEENGHLVLNILKVVFLVAVLVAFWILFDRWLAGK